MKQQNKFENCSLYGVSFGDNSTVNNGKSMDDELMIFAQQGEKILEKYDPVSQEYMILNPAVQYAKRQQKGKFIEAIKKHSLDIWKNIFSDVAAEGLLYIIKKWII